MILGWRLGRFRRRWRIARCISWTGRRCAKGRGLERIGEQGVRLWIFLNLTSTPVCRHGAFVYLHSIHPHSHCILSSANVILGATLRCAYYISLLGIYADLGSQGIVSPIHFDEMQMRRLCREAYLCRVKRREGDRRSTRTFAGEGYRWSIIAGGACLVQKLRKRANGWGTVWLEQIHALAKNDGRSASCLRNRHIHAKFDATFTHLDESAQQDESTMGPHRITAPANALSMRCSFAYLRLTGIIGRVFVGTNEPRVSCFTIDRSES